MLSPMPGSRLYKIAHCNQSVSSDAPARRREPPIRGEKSIMTGAHESGSLIKTAHIARFIVAARLIVQDHEGVPMMPLFRLSSGDIARRPSPCDVPRGPCCGERYRSKTDTTERM